MIRGRVLLATLGLGFLGLCALVLFRPEAQKQSPIDSRGPTPAEPTQPLSSSPQAQSSPATGTGSLPASGVGNSNSSASGPNAQKTTAAPDDQPDLRKEARIAQLHELSHKTDRASADILLSEVRNPDPEIRDAALDSITQSGNRALIPGLEEAAEQTEDSAQKQAITEAIEFLKLPTLTELLRQGQSKTTSPSGAPPKAASQDGK